MKAIAFIVSFLFAPLIALAANDALLQSGTEITANSITMTVGESSADSITVDGGSFDAVLSNGSSLSLTASGKNTFTVSPTSAIESFPCNSSNSVLILKGPQSGSQTVTVTPSSSTCSGGGGGVVSSGGGGGGGGGGASVTVAPAVSTVPAATVAQPSATAQAVSPVFNTSLSVGVSSPDVKRLQQLLNSDPDTRIAAAGAGSPGNESNFFGSLTRQAVEKFQVKYGLAKAGDAGYGLVGPKTRAKLSEVFAKATPTAPSVAQPGVVAQAVSPVFNTSLFVGVSSPDVKRLQQLLNSDPDTRIAAAGAGSPGNESNFFGSLTRQAVEKFQVKYGLAKAGDAGYGLVGPKTRAKLQEVFKQ